MIQQNKTDQAVGDGSSLSQQQPQKVDETVRLSQNQPHCQQHNESKIQIVLPVRKSHDCQDDLSLPITLIQSQTQNQQPQAPLKQLKQSHPKPNINDVSAVCIDLYSENEPIERKCTLNSLHYSRILAAQLRKDDKVLVEQGIQTSAGFMQDGLVQQMLIREQAQFKGDKLPENEHPSLAQLKEKRQLAHFIQKVQKQPVSEPFSAEIIEQPQTIITTSHHAQQAKTSLKQTLVNGQNKSDSQIELSIKQTAYLNSLESSLPQIRNRNVTFQALQTTNQQENRQDPLMIQIENVEDQETGKFLQGVDENEYDKIISQLSAKIALLQLHYSQLVSQNNPNQILQKAQQHETPQETHTQNKPKPQQPAHKLSIHHKTCNLSISLNLLPPNHAQQSQSPKQPKPISSYQYQQPSTSKLVQVSDRRSLKIKQFSSGDVSNLLAQSQTQLIDLRDLQAPQNSPSDLNQLSQIPVVFSSSLSPQNSLESPQNSLESIASQLPVILVSQSNLAIVKESYQELPYERFKNIMSQDSILSKISFKEKHYPSFTSTDKQLKLYGKRLLRLFYEQPPNSPTQVQPVNMLSLQNDLQYYKSQQHVVYYLKTNQNFIFICYFNHTIYIGQYITQGPMKQITRQGYGIQIRQSKYIYQGEFFADKKHGYGYIEFLGKNPFVYTGYFLDGFMDGYGKAMSESGEVYIGDYKLGQRDGVGKLVYCQGKSAYYEGEFYDGYKHGKGYELFDNRDSYKGTYLRDKFQGQGHYKWKNSTTYQGTFVQGSKHGPGLLIYANGQTFDKYYDHNKQINLQDDKKTIKSSRISTYSQNKLQQKTFIQQKPRNFKNTRSVSGQSLLSYKSKSNQKSTKLIKDKNKIAQLLRQKQIQDDLKNLDKILKDPTDQGKIKKIFSVKKLDTRDKIIGKMYNTTERPSMKISEKGELDLIKLSKIGSQRKSLVNFDSQEKLEELRESTHHRRVQRTTNFSQF